MAKQVYCDVEFLDAAERTAIVSYPMATLMADDGANFAAVQSEIDDLITALNVLSWDAINHAEMRIVAHTATDTANVSANNQVHARSYASDATGETGSFDVPGWDDFTYDEDEFNLLSAAYNALANNVLPLIRNSNLELFTGSVKRSVSRTHKSRGKKVV